MENEKNSKKTSIPVWCIVLIIFLFFSVIILLCVVSFFIGKEFSNKTDSHRQFSKITAVQKPRYEEEQASLKRVTQSEESSGAYPAVTSQSEKPLISQPAGTFAQTPGSLGDESEKTRVENYFSQIDLIAESVKNWDDPNVFAQELLKSIMSSDFSSFDDFVLRYDTTISKINQLSAPKDCKEHKKAMMEALTGGKEMLLILRSSIESGDIAAITSLTIKGEEIKRKSEIVERMEKEIKSRYNIL